MVATLFEKNIKKLNFSFLKKKREGGVNLTNKYEKLSENIASPNILFALETAKEKFEADAVYFRYFNDGRGAIPQIYIFDYTHKKLTEDDKKRIHKQMWSGNQIPLYIIIERSLVSVHDAREKLKDKKESYAHDIISMTGKTIRDFQANSFDVGLFWDEYNERNYFKFEQSATKDLIRGLKKVYRSFREKSGLDRHIALKLLVQSLLIKYLEERDEVSKSGYFAGRYFQTHFKSKNFCDVIRKGKLLDLLDQLASDFNGKIFEWNKEKETEAREAIRKAEVIRLAEYLDGKIENSQYVLWRLYSFSHLPVEVISSVYEELLTDSKDIVYTPEMIVSTLIDECMPIKSPRQEFKLIDVSCGSGIFLVKAYKRIIQWWRYEQWQNTGELKKPSLDTLKDLLLKSIHGIDIQQDAIRLAVFSLSLALLDEVDLNPPTWQKLKFPDLSENIKIEDFFKFIAKNPAPDFDLVIGNPPFNLQHINGKEPDRKEYFKNLSKEIGYNSEISIPNENPALHFLIQSMKLLSTDAMLCLIQPSGPLLYQKNINFKQALFSKYNLLQIIDFTKLADVLWGIKKVATAAVFLQNSKPSIEDVVHIVVNRTFSNINRLFLEFDHYDFHFVDKDAIINNPYIWKTNLLGGGRLVQMIEHLSQLPTLGNYLERKRKECKWIIGDGFIKGKPDDTLASSDFEKKYGGYSTAPFLTGNLCFDPEDFDENGIKKTYIINDKYFQWKRNPELFQAPLVMIKKNIGKNSIPVIYSEKDISFKNEIIGIHAPIKDKALLKKIETTIKDNELYRFYLSLISSRSGVSRSVSTLLQEDILSIPYSEKSKNIQLLNTEKILVEDVLTYQIDKKEKDLKKSISESQTKEFSKTFCWTLNSVYQLENKSFQLYKILDTGTYYALHFEYTNKSFEPQIEKINDLEQYIQKIIPTKKEKGKSFRIQRIMKVYGRDCIILAKPKQLRYWLPSIALRDADETFTDYIKARYQNAQG